MNKMNSVLRWHCAYDDCPEMLNDVEHNINRKYCNLHQKIRVKEQNKIKCANYYKKNPRGREKCCVICGNKLKSASKYCSKSCHNWAIQNKKQTKKMRGLCHICYLSNVSLVINEGQSICKSCFKKQNPKNRSKQ